MKIGFFIIREEDGEMLEAEREHFELGMAESENASELEDWLKKNAEHFVVSAITEWRGIYHAEFYPANK